MNDHLTPAQQREGTGARLSSAGLVRGGAMLVARIDRRSWPSATRATTSRRWGARCPRRGALAALEAAFPMPDEMVASMRRQIEIAFGGI